MRGILRVAAISALLLCAGPCAASAAPPSTGDVLLPFGAGYTAADGEPATHRGVDVRAATGSSVDSPAAGTVVFAGRVPAAGGGGTVLAVTLESNGTRVSLLPLESVDVGAGDVVECGDRIGTLASAGDGSWPQPHLHIGLRRGDVYLDPAVLLAAAPSSKTEADSGPVAVSAEPAASGADAPAQPDVRRAPPTTPAASPQLAAAATRSTSTDPAGATSSAARRPALADARAGSARLGDGSAAASELAPGVSLAPGGLSQQPLGSPAPIDTLERQPPLGHVARALGRIKPTPISIALLAGVSYAVFLLLTQRVLSRRIAVGKPVSHRWEKLLQALRTGDTLCGLNSCSGHLPSQSRGH